MQFAAAGMDAQKSALDVLARNVAITETASPDHPVHALEPQFAVAGEDDGDGNGDDAQFSAALASSSGGAPSPFGVDGESDDGAGTQLPGQVSFAGARLGKAAVTGVDAVSEMVAVLGAQRAYEANASVFDTGKRLVEKTLDVERT